MLLRMQYGSLEATKEAVDGKPKVHFMWGFNRTHYCILWRCLYDSRMEMSTLWVFTDKSQWYIESHEFIERNSTSL